MLLRASDRSEKAGNGPFALPALLFRSPLPSRLGLALSFSFSLLPVVLVLALPTRLLSPLSEPLPEPPLFDRVFEITWTRGCGHECTRISTHYSKQLRAVSERR